MFEYFPDLGRAFYIIERVFETGFCGVYFKNLVQAVWAYGGIKIQQALMGGGMLSAGWCHGSLHGKGHHSCLKDRLFCGQAENTAGMAGFLANA